MCEAVAAYVAPVYANQDDQRPLSIIGVSRALHISRQTLRKHEQDAVLLAALEFRSKARPREDSKVVSNLKKRLSEIETQCREWQARYHGLLEQLTRMEFYLRQDPRVDLDNILSKALPKPNRSMPAASRRNGSSGTGGRIRRTTGRDVDDIPF